MQEVFRTQDFGEAAIIKSLLQSAGIEFFVFDEISAATLGGICEPCRFMVLEEDYPDARAFLKESGVALRDE